MATVAFPGGATAVPMDEDDSRWSAWIQDAEDGAIPLDIHTAASLGDEQVVVEALQK